MDYRTIEKPAFPVAGKSIRVITEGGQNFSQIPEFWTTCVQDGTLTNLLSLAVPNALPPGTTLGICSDFTENMEEFTYMIAVETPDSPEGLAESTVPALTFAAFTSVGPMPEAIQNVWINIFSEFFPSEPYVHASGPDLEIYPPGNPMASDYTCEVWVPVVPK